MEQKDYRQILQRLSRDDHDFEVDRSGIGDEDLVLLGSFMNYFVCRRLAKRLAAADITARLDFRQKQICVSVSKGDFPKAIEIKRDQELRDPDKISGWGRRFWEMISVLLFLSFLIAFVLAAILQDNHVIVGWVWTVGLGYLGYRLGRYWLIGKSIQFRMDIVLLMIVFFALMIALTIALDRIPPLDVKGLLKSMGF